MRMQVTIFRWVPLKWRINVTTRQKCGRTRRGGKLKGRCRVQQKLMGSSTSDELILSIGQQQESWNFFCSQTLRVSDVHCRDQVDQRHRRLVRAKRWDMVLCITGLRERTIQVSEWIKVPMKVTVTILIQQHNILGATSKDGFELVVWPMVEETMRETFRNRRQSVFAAMSTKFIGKRIVSLSMCWYDWWF